MLENELPFFPQMFFLIAFPGPVYRSSLLLVAQARSLELVLFDRVLVCDPAGFELGAIIPVSASDITGMCWSHS